MNRQRRGPATKRGRECSEALRGGTYSFSDHFLCSWPGALDAATKQALQIALSVLARCGPCIRIQVEKARKMSFTQEEIDEAVWMAIAFGGAPVMMFYKEVMKT
jgi:AhpD family alkylhydroperoxidase